LSGSFDSAQDDTGVKRVLIADLHDMLHPSCAYLCGLTRHSSGADSSSLLAHWWQRALA